MGSGSFAASSTSSRYAAVIRSPIARSARDRIQGSGSSPSERSASSVASFPATDIGIEQPNDLAAELAVAQCVEGLDRLRPHVGVGRAQASPQQTGRLGGTERRDRGEQLGLGPSLAPADESAQELDAGPVRCADPRWVCRLEGRGVDAQSGHAGDPLMRPRADGLDHLGAGAFEPSDRRLLGTFRSRRQHLDHGRGGEVVTGERLGGGPANGQGVVIECGDEEGDRGRLVGALGVERWRERLRGCRTHP